MEEGITSTAGHSVKGPHSVQIHRTRNQQTPAQRARGDQLVFHWGTLEQHAWDQQRELPLQKLRRWPHGARAVGGGYKYEEKVPLISARFAASLRLSHCFVGVGDLVEGLRVHHGRRIDAFIPAIPLLSRLPGPWQIQDFPQLRTSSS